MELEVNRVEVKVLIVLIRFRVILLLLGVMIFFGKLSFAVSGLYFEPKLGIGFGLNDNLDQVSENVIESNASLLSCGLGTSLYFNSDLYFSSNVDYFLEQSFESDYGNISNSFMNIGLYYDFLYNVNIGADIGFEVFSDSVNRDASYSNNFFVPKLFYAISPYSVIGVMAEGSNLVYDGSDEKVRNQKNGGYITQQIFSDINLSFGGYYLSSNSSVSSVNYRGQLANLGIEVPVGNKSAFFFSYDLYNLEYQNWTIERSDRKSVMGLVYSQDLSNELFFKASYDNIYNESNDDNYDFTNNIFSFVINWQPVFGEQYPDGYESDVDFYYGEAIKAIDLENYSVAEKQLRKVVFWITDSPDVFFELGFVLHKQTKYNEAIEYFERVISIESDRVEVYYLLIYDLVKVGNKKRAKELLFSLWQKTGDEKVKKMFDDM